MAIVNLHKNMSTKSPECWANDTQARAVRVEMSPEQSLLLPHNDFVFAELKREGKEQVLRKRHAEDLLTRSMRTYRNYRSCESYDASRCTCRRVLSQA